MSKNYIFDPITETVHLLRTENGGEFTFCGVQSVDADCGGFEGKPHAGPATCIECFNAIEQLKDDFGGAKWKFGS